MAIAWPRDSVHEVAAGGAKLHHLREARNPMKPEIVGEVIRELQARGFSAELLGPHGSIAFSRRYLEGETLAGLHDLVLCRREKMFRPAPELGQELGRAAYEDAILAVEAVGTVIGRLAGDL